MPDTLPPNTPPIDRWVPLLRETLQKEGRFFWQVKGQSMLPTLPPDCTIEIHAVGADVQIGDIVVFAYQDALVVHRLVARRGNILIIQGDNRTVPDPPIQFHHIIGRVGKATYQQTLKYPCKFERFVTHFWIARYYSLKLRRFLDRKFRSKHRI